MKLYFPLRADAQAKADAIHQWMIDNTPGYAKSVEQGYTKRWATPAQDVDSKGAPLTAEWFIVTKDRCYEALSAVEKANLLPS